MADIEITDEASLEAWLKTRPRRDAEIIAFRAAARVFPLLGREFGESGALLWENSKIRYLGGLPILRLLVAYMAALTRQASEETSAVTSAQFAFSNSRLKIELLDFASVSLPVFNLAVATRRSIKVFSKTESPVGRCIAVLRAVAAIDKNFATALSKLLESEVEIVGLGLYINDSPLWPTPAPEWFTTADRETRAIWAKDPPTWAFWEKWWDGVISGDMPFAPDLLRDVALIEDDIWQAGPREVAARINLLIQRHALQREAAAINAKLMEFISLTEGLGANLHNQPPNEELSPIKLRASLREISQALKEIEVALDGPEISPEVVAGLGQRLKDLWDGLAAKVKLAIQVIAISILTSVGTDIYQSIKANIDIPSFSRRLLDFGKELEKMPSPAPVFPPRPPVDL